MVTDAQHKSPIRENDVFRLRQVLRTSIRRPSSRRRCGSNLAAIRTPYSAIRHPGSRRMKRRPQQGSMPSEEEQCKLLSMDPRFARTT
jgi:hypothetical protein